MKVFCMYRGKKKKNQQKKLYFYYLKKKEKMNHYHDKSYLKLFHTIIIVVLN